MKALIKVPLRILGYLLALVFIATYIGAPLHSFLADGSIIPMIGCWGLPVAVGLGMAILWAFGAYEEETSKGDSD